MSLGKKFLTFVLVLRLLLPSLAFAQSFATILPFGEPFTTCNDGSFAGTLPGAAGHAAQGAGNRYRVGLPGRRAVGAGGRGLYGRADRGLAAPGAPPVSPTWPDQPALALRRRQTGLAG